VRWGWKFYCCGCSTLSDEFMVVLSIGSTSTSMHGSRMAGSWYPSGKVILYNIAKRVKAVSGGLIQPSYSNTLHPLLIYKFLFPCSSSSQFYHLPIATKFIPPTRSHQKQHASSSVIQRPLKFINRNTLPDHEQNLPRGPRSNNCHYAIHRTLLHHILSLLGSISS
jgi:hypothetical protein